MMSRRARRQLDVGALPHPLHPVDLPGPFLPHLGAVTRQVPQVALCLRRAQARLHQAMAPPIGQPARLRSVRLPPRPVRHRRGVDHAHRTGAFQQVIDRFPVLAGTLHGPRGDPGLGQPLGQGPHVARQRD